MASEAKPYESSITVWYLQTWRIVQHDIATWLLSRGRHFGEYGISRSLENRIVGRWMHYLDQVQEVVERATIANVDSSLRDAWEAADRASRHFPKRPPSCAPSDVPRMQLADELSFLARATTLDILAEIGKHAAAPSRPLHAVLAARSVANAALPMLGRVMVHARTTVNTTARREVRAYLREHPDFYRGWTWVSSLRMDDCVACWAMHGTTHRLQEELDDHPNGNCKVAPWLHHQQPPRTGEDIFAHLAPRDQEAILGSTRYARYRAGDVSLSDCVVIDNSEWGTSVGTKPLRDMAHEHNA